MQHTDLHLAVPRYFDADRLHAISERVRAVVLGATSRAGDVIVHFDPCRPRQCPGCAMPECPVRSARFEERRPVSLERALRRGERVAALPGAARVRDDLRADRFPVRSASPRGFAQAFVDVGEGPALLLIHGWPETMRIWWRNVAPLAAAGFRVIVPDLRGFGASEVGPDGFHDTPTHSRDLHALVWGELGVDRVVAVAGDLGGAVLQDLALRFPGFVERAVIFNSPLPYLKERMAGLRTRPPVEAADYFIRQGTDADGLAAELATPELRRRYIATFYSSRFWAHPGAFDAASIAFHVEPFGDGAKLRASFGGYEAAIQPARRSETPLLGENPTHALILLRPLGPRHLPGLRPDGGVRLPRPRRAVRRARRRPLPPVGGGRRPERRDPLVLSRSLAMSRVVRAYVALGSNLGDRAAHLAGALAALARDGGRSRASRARRSTRPRRSARPARGPT